MIVNSNYQLAAENPCHTSIQDMIGVAHYKSDCVILLTHSCVFATEGLQPSQASCHHDSSDRQWLGVPLQTP